MVKPVLYLIIVAEQQFEFVYVKHGTYIGHLGAVHLCPTAGIGKENYALRVVDQSHYAVGLEIGQDGHYYRTVRVYCQIGKSPAGTILCAQGYMVTFLYACVFKYYVKTRYGTCHLGICECLASDVVQCRFIPILSCSGLKPFQIMWIFLHNQSL